MSELRAITSDRASRGTGGYTPAIVAGDLVFVSGQGPLDAETLEIRGSTISEQTHHTLNNVVALVEAAGGTREDIVRCNCYLASIELFDEFTEAYEHFFDQETLPTRTTIGCELSEILVEIDCIAYVRTPTHQ